MKFLHVLSLLSIIQVSGKLKGKGNRQRVLFRDSKQQPHNHRHQAREKSAPPKKFTSQTPPIKLKNALLHAEQHQFKGLSKRMQYNIVAYLTDLGYVGQDNATFKLAGNNFCSKNWTIATVIQAFLGM